MVIHHGIIQYSIDNIWHHKVISYIVILQSDDIDKPKPIKNIKQEYRPWR